MPASTERNHTAVIMGTPGHSTLRAAWFPLIEKFGDFNMADQNRGIARCIAEKVFRFRVRSCFEQPSDDSYIHLRSCIV